MSAPDSAVAMPRLSEAKSHPQVTREKRDGQDGNSAQK